MEEKFIITIISQLGSSFIQLIAFYMLFLKLDIELLGLFSFLTSVVNMGFLLINIGLDLIHLQYSSKDDFSDYFCSFFIIKILIISINVIITFILMGFLNIWNFNYVKVLLFILFSKILVEFSNIFVIHLKSRLKIFKIEIPYFLINLIRSLSIIYLVFNYSEFNDPIFYLSISNFTFDLLFLITIISISKREFKIKKPNKRFIIKYFRDVIPLFFFSIILVISTNLGNLILAYSFGYSYLGYVSLVNTYILPFISIISASILNLYLTIISYEVKTKEIGSVKKLAHLIERYFSIVFLTIIIIIYLNGDMVFSIFLPSYLRSVPILYIMIFIPYLIAISEPYAYLFIAFKKQSIIASINSITRVFIILLMIFLISTSFFFLPALGLGDIGYAFSQTIPWILWGFLCRFYSKKKLNINSQPKIFFHILIAFVSLFLVFVLKEFILIELIRNQVIIIIITSFITLLLFFTLLIAFKQIKKEDYNNFKNILNLKKYIRSIKEEFIPT